MKDIISCRLIWQVGQLRKLTRDTGVALILLITAKL